MSLSKRERKSFDQLTVQESQLYFFCLRLMHIFQEPSEAIQFQFIHGFTDKTSTVVPKCMYDNLIGFHCTCCEHQSQFFPYWHRAQLIKFQEYLMKVHQKITSNQLIFNQTRRLVNLVIKIHKKILNSDQVKQLWNLIQTLLVKIQIKYKTIIGNQKITYIPGHYWNVFNTEKQINYPQGFYRNGPTDPIFQEIDQLIRIVWDQDSIYQINFKTRFNANLDHFKYDPPQNYQQYVKLFDEKQKKFIWTNPQRATVKDLEIAENFATNDKYNYLLYRQYLKRGKQDPNKLTFNVFDQEQVNYVFGGKGYQYFKDTSDLKTRPFKIARNSQIAYYTYCKSLLTKDQDFMVKFCSQCNESNDFSLENPHNEMHNDQGYIFQDGSFSTTNPIFFSYHSFIDLMLQYKITNYLGSQREAAKAASNFLSLQFKAKTDSQQTFKKNWINKFKKENQREPKNTQYPVLYWISKNGKKQGQNLSEFDYKFLRSSYESIILSQDHNKLKTLKELFNIEYNIDRSFQNTITETLPNVPSPYSKLGLYVAMQIKHKSTIRSKNLNIKLKNMKGDIAATKVYPIFSKGIGAVNCPNCPQYKTNVVLFPVEELLPTFKNMMKLRSNGNQDEEPVYIIKNKVNLYSSLSYRLSQQQVTARFVTGRKNLKVKVVNPINSGKDVRVHLEIEQKFIKQKQNALQILRSREPFIFAPQETIHQKIFETSNQFNIISIQAQHGQKIISYDFNFYSEYSQVEFNFGQKQQILSKQNQINGLCFDNIIEKTRVNQGIFIKDICSGLGLNQNVIKLAEDQFE